MASTKKRGLGRGLNALIGGTEAEEVKKEEKKSVNRGKGTPRQEDAVKEKPQKEKDGVLMVDIHLITTDKSQPRESFDEESLEELTASVKQYGILQPLIVTQKQDYYQIIAGERRFRAAMKAGLSSVPVIIKEFSPEETLAVSLIENIQRDNLNPMEEAKAYQRLMKDYSLTQEKIAEKVGKSRPFIANSLRLLSLDPEVQSLVASKELSSGHAKVLLGIEDSKAQAKLAKVTVQKGWSVRQLEKAAKLLKTEKVPVEEVVDKQLALILKETGREMQDILGTKVNIVQGKKKGMIEIEYYSDEELERLLAMIRSLR